MKDKPIAYYICFSVLCPLLAVIDFQQYAERRRMLALVASIGFSLGALYMFVQLWRTIRHKKAS